MRHNQDAAVAAATVADEARSALLADLLGRVAGCFPRRETRQCCGQMVSGLLMELDDHNCWTIAEAAGHRGPHRLQHLLSRAVWDDRRVLDIASAWAVSHLDDGDAVLIVDETADEKSSADCVGAARQYSGTVGGVALCQVAVTLTYATGRGHALIGRALYLPEGCAADEEHRELAGVPEENHQLAKQAAGLDSGQVIRWKSWHRWTAICLLAYIYLAVAVAAQRQHDAGSDLDAGLIPVTVPELLRLLRILSSRRPGVTGPTGCTGRTGDAATSTAPAKPTNARTPTPRQHRDVTEQRVRYRPGCEMAVSARLGRRTARTSARALGPGVSGWFLPAAGAEDVQPDTLPGQPSAPSPLIS